MKVNYKKELDEEIRDHALTKIGLLTCGFAPTVILGMIVSGDYLYYTAIGLLAVYATCAQVALRRRNERLREVKLV